MKKTFDLLILLVVAVIQSRSQIPTSGLEIKVIIGTRVNSQSTGTLYLDVTGRDHTVTEFGIEQDFQNGEIRTVYLNEEFGPLVHIRLYQNGQDGLRVRRLEVRDGIGREYTFLCNCWIQTDQPAPDSRQSWTLYPMNGVLWEVTVFTHNMRMPTSSNTNLYLDVYSTQGSILEFSLGGSFQSGDIRHTDISAELGTVNRIRLYQTGEEGIRIRKVIMEDVNDRRYEFSCDCWIQTDQSRTDSKPSWTLYPDSLSEVWEVNIFVGTMAASESSGILLLDVEGTDGSLSEFSLGSHFAVGEIRRVHMYENFGKINSIRLYQRGVDGLRVRKVAIEDEEGHQYHFKCDCWIQTDQPAPDSSSSWTLYPIGLDIRIFIGTRAHSPSTGTLFLDVTGRDHTVTGFSIEQDFQNGEIREVYLNEAFGPLNNIRLYQNGEDGLRVRRVEVKDKIGREYTFLCNCWIQTDQPALDSRSSWTLYPMNGVLLEVTVFTHNMRRSTSNNDNLYLDVYSTQGSILDFSLGGSFYSGEIRHTDISAELGTINRIRLYQTGEEGIRIRKVIMKDESDRRYEFSCDCWIQIDQSTADSKPSWTLYPESLSEVWEVNIFVGTMAASESNDNLLLDVEGTDNSLSEFSLGSHFSVGELRRVHMYENFGRIDSIRLYQRGVDGLRVRKVVIEDEDGRPYSFKCDCWIQTDQPAPDSRSSWTLYPIECYWNDNIQNCAEVMRVSCQLGKCDTCNEGFILQGGICTHVSTTTTNTVSTATNTQTTPISDASTTVVPASTPATRSDIECLTNSISLHIPLGLLPTGQQVTWQDPSCVVADNGTHLVGTIGLGDCGTYVVFNSSHVTFENELVSSAGSTSTTTSGIDYGSESNSVIVVQCVYPRRETGSTAFRAVQGHVRFFEKTIGHMQVHMRQARDATFADIYPSQTEPREVHLNDKLYIKLTADQGSPVKVAINVDRCLATPSPSPLDTEYQELTNNGCPAIPSVSIHNSSSSEVHLSFRAFQFRSHPGAPVYVHCEVYVCPLSHPQCVAGCTNIAAARTRRAALSDVKSHLVSTGPFPVTNEKEQGAFGGQSIALIAVTGLCACLAVVATVFGILAWKGMRRQAKEIN